MGALIFITILLLVFSIALVFNIVFLYKVNNLINIIDFKDKNDIIESDQVEELKDIIRKQNDRIQKLERDYQIMKSKLDTMSKEMISYDSLKRVKNLH